MIAATGQAALAVWVGDRATMSPTCHQTSEESRSLENTGITGAEDGGFELSFW